MNPNKKVILIIILGIGACLLSVIFSRFFVEQDKKNKTMLAQIQQAEPHLEHIRLLTIYFIQNPDAQTWEQINYNMKIVRQYFNPDNFKTNTWQEEATELNRNLETYHSLLGRIHQPAIQLHEQKLALQGIGLSFIQEVETGIIQLFRNEEGLNLYSGQPLDPLKSRVKDTAYDLVSLYNKQQLILQELLLNSDLERYQAEKRKLSEAMFQRETQLRFINVLMADEAGIHDTLSSLEKKLNNLVQKEEVIVGRFTTLSDISRQLETAGNELIRASKNVSQRIQEDTNASSHFYAKMSWGLTSALVIILGLLGAWLGSDIIHFVRDLRKAKEELQESETNLRVTLYSIGDAVIATDAEGVVTRINPSAENLTGWHAEAAIGRSLKDVFHIVHAHTRKRMANPVEKILKSGEVVGLANHTVLVSKSGREYQIADSGAPIRDDDGAIVGVVMVFRDVSEAYENEQKIRDSERLLMNLTANVPGVVFQNSADQETGAITMHFISPNVVDILGINVPNQAFYQTFVDHIHQEDREDFATSVRAAVRGAQRFVWEGRFIKVSGENAWVSINAVPQKEHGRLVYYGVLMDATERKSWEYVLKASEERYRRLFNDAPMMYVINDHVEDKPVIRDVNHMFLTRLGYEKNDVIGRPLDEYYSEKSSHVMFGNGVNHRTVGGEFVSGERDLLTSDGEIVHTLLHAVPEYDNQNRVVGTRAMFLDITQRKQAQQETKRLESALTQAQKMEAIGTLAGGIAHDFNNILSAVIGYSELVISKLEQESELNEYMQQVLSAGMRARDLVEQILAFSRQSEKELKPLQVGMMVKEALKLLRSSLPSTIEIRQDISTQLNNILADPTQIHQIIMNLCTNAAQAMEESGGVLGISLNEVDLTAADLRLYPGLVSGTYIELVVQDTGQGIPPDIRDNIFDPYFTTKKQGKGTGLGLAVAHGIVQNYGGAIHAYSEMGQGTSFKVYFPAIQIDQLPEDIQPVEPPKGHERILLVDDEPVLTEIGQLTLKGLGYSVQVANSGREALDILEQMPKEIDLIISDMTMPKMTGDQLTTEALKIRKDLPIILCTGFSNRISKERAEEIGAKALIMKPFVSKELAIIIRNVLDGTTKESRH